MPRLSFITLSLILLIASCNRKPAETSSVSEIAIEPRTVNSVYFWKTVFRLDSAERDFIDSHNIGKIYMRMFDVAADANVVSSGQATYPNATIRIDHPSYRLLKDTLCHMEVTPVVYITLDALKAMQGDEKTLAENIVTRVRNMCEYNALPNVKEMQLDCDWTASTEDSFFRLCDSVRNSIDRLNLSWKLSSTIRLHQLSRKAPPVDRGVLMVYNTGSFNNPDSRNSIIDVKDVAPYLKHIPSYALPIDVAYPTYSWQLLFHKRQFMGLLNGADVADTAKFTRVDDNTYMAVKDIPCNAKIIRKGDIVRCETSDFSEINAVKKLIERRLAGKPHGNILYHLDSHNLSTYSDNEIQTLLSSDC